jgi:hypothetical protein
MAAKLKHWRRVMKRVTVILMALALVLAGATVVLAQDLPQALKGVNLSTAQVLTDAQAQQIRGCKATQPQGVHGVLTGQDAVEVHAYSHNTQAWLNIFALYIEGSPSIYSKRP